MSVPVRSAPSDGAEAVPPGGDELALPSPASTDSRVAEAPKGLRAALGPLSGFALLALTNAIAIAVSVPLPRGGLLLRALHHVFDLAQTVGLGAAVALAVGAWTRFVRARAWVGVLAYFAVAMPLIVMALGSELYRQACVALDGRFVGPIHVTYLILCGLAVPAAHTIGTLLLRWRWTRVATLLVALGGIVTNHVILRDDQPSLHGMVGWSAATLAGAALVPTAERVVNRLSRRALRAGAAAVAVLAVLGLFLPPPNAVRVELFREPGSLAAWVLARFVWPPAALERAGAAPVSPWFAERSGLPPVRPKTPPLAENPVVVLVTIDSVRADVIQDPNNDSVFPLVAELKRSGAYFTRATSPGSQTAVSLTAVFSGRYFSQTFWSLHGVGETRFVYAADDSTERFPEILSARGVRTASICSVNFLANEFGVLRGFAEEKIIPQGRRHAGAQETIDPVVERLRKAGDEPLFLFVHLMEPHFPYDRGKKKGTDLERYVSEIGVADAQLARVSRILAQRFPRRGFLFVAADHGEAFGEHGTIYHTKTLYEELLRVPLLVRGPGVVARRIEQHVTLMDLGPTILDLFGVETPPGFMGQSLVPLLRGGSATLDRPVLAEGRLRRALYVGESLKVIEDDRRKVVEVYDLATDPGETLNLFDRDHALADPAVGALRAFFSAHAVARPGYAPPYKP